MKLCQITVGFIIVLSSSAVADNLLQPRLVSASPVIDGVLNDSAWKNAPSVTGFHTWYPDYGKRMDQQTEVWMAYDPENLYFAFRCFDDPSAIKTSTAARDKIRADDWIGINLDTFGDQQSLYVFYVNPNGIQSDTRYAGGNEDPGADYVWYSAGNIHEEGYDIEIRIPLKSIRYSDRDPVVMGVIFERRVSRSSVMGTYPPLDPEQGESWLTQMYPLMYPDLERFTLLEVLPAFVYNEQKSHKNGTLSYSDVRRNASLTLKYGITSDLVFDATYNPDFSQIEADAGQVDVNLRSALFYPEKRSFFLEGREYFNLAATGDISPVNVLVHTRTIVDPQVGLKVSGKMGPSNIVSVLYANDRLPDASGGLSEDAHALVARFRRRLADDSYVGATAISRSHGSAYNTAGGVDGMYRFSNNATIQAHVLASRSRSGTPLSISDGYAAAAVYDKSERDISYGAGVSDVASNFRADLGYLSRSGIRSFKAYVKPRFYPESEIVNRLEVGFTSFNSQDIASGLWETSQVLTTSLLHLKRLAFVLNAAYATEVFQARRFGTSNLYLSWGGQMNAWLTVRASFQTGESIYYGVHPFSGNAQRASSQITLQPSDNISLEYVLTYAQFGGDTTSAFDFSYPINRLKLTYQVNSYLFFRWIAEYNGFRKRFPTDFLASFTYIPGTVLHVGYGMIYNRREWDPLTFAYVPSSSFLRTNTGLFLKASYLWRL